MFQFSNKLHIVASKLLKFYCKKANNLRKILHQLYHTWESKKWILGLKQTLNGFQIQLKPKTHDF